MRKQYIENNSLENALTEYLSNFAQFERTEVLPIEKSLGKICAKSVFASLSDPFYNAAAMDGILVVAKNTENASFDKPLELVCHKDFEFVNTGGVVGRFDACIMIEDVTLLENGNVQIVAPARLWQHIRIVGESISAGEMIVNKNRKIRAFDIGAMRAAGTEQIEVKDNLKIGFIPSGNEIVDSPKEVAAGKILQSNSYLIGSRVEELGQEFKKYETAKDEIGDIEQKILLAACENDVVLINAGSSAGTKDFTFHAIEKLGKVCCHGLAIKPGKPTVLGIVNNKPVIGLPGYPLSANIVFEKVVIPVLSRLLGKTFKEREVVQAKLTRRVNSTFKAEQFTLVNVGFNSGEFFATPMSEGASNLQNLVKADGIVTIKRELEGVEKGEIVQVELLRELDEIKKSLVVIGSHDVILDVARDFLPITSAHVGSYGGLLSLQSGSAMLAPCHILDEESGEYNVSAIKELFGEGKVALIRGVKRLQGFYSRKSENLEIRSVKDLVGKTFANRQRGSGTRILFDHLLKKEGMKSCAISGYEKEFTTHFAVASAVSEGTFDTGLGIYSIAKAYDLRFDEVAFEQYDFAVLKENLEDERVQKFIEVICSDEFKREVTALGGYQTDGIGEIVEI